MAEKMLQIKQVRSGVGRKFRHRRTLEALGFKKHQQTVLQRDTPQIRGMLKQVWYLVEVEEVEGS